MEAHRGPGMPVKERHLLGQLQRIDPVVVSLAQCEVLAASGTQGVGEVRVGTDVLGPEDRPEQMRVAFGILPDDRRGGVGRGIVGDDDLHGEVGLLGDKAVEGLSDVSLVVVGD